MAVSIFEFGATQTVVGILKRFGKGDTARRKFAMKELTGSCFGLLESVIGRSHYQDGIYVFEAHVFAQDFELSEFVRVNVAHDREMLFGGLQVLAQGKDVRALSGQVF